MGETGDAERDPGRRLPAPRGECWYCGQPAVCGQRLPGRRRVRGLCAQHADAVLGPAEPPWAGLDARDARAIAEDWMRSLTLACHSAGQHTRDLYAQIAEVNQPGRLSVELVTPLLPGEARTLSQTLRALQHLHSRETTIYLAVTVLLVGWLEAAGQDRSDVLQRLALALEQVLPPAGNSPGAA